MNEVSDPLRDPRALLILEKHSAGLLQYYSTLRQMLANFNQMILSAHMQGATFVLAGVSAAFLLFSSSNLAVRFGAILLLGGALLLCRNLRAQVDFFTNMLSTTTKVAQQVEAMMLAYADPSEAGQLKAWEEICITKQLRAKFPGDVYLKRRRELFNTMQWVLWVLLIFAAAILFYQVCEKYSPRVSGPPSPSWWP